MRVFKYIDEVKGDELKRLKASRRVYVDPGRSSIFYMISDKRKKNNKETVFNYTNKRYLRETKRLKFQKLINKYKNKYGITDEEAKLSDHNGKTCDYKKFTEYIKVKTEVNNHLFEAYANEYFRKLKWYAYINRRRADDKMLRDIERMYGKNIIIIMGDCCEGNSCIKFISTPNKRLKTKLKEKFIVYFIDEFRTSVLNWKTEQRQNNWSAIDREGKRRKIHHILTYKTESGRMGCINRDLNAARNIRKLTQHYLKTGERLSKYRREKTTDEKALKTPRKTRSNKISKKKNDNIEPIDVPKKGVRKTRIPTSKTSEDPKKRVTRKTKSNQPDDSDFSAILPELEEINEPSTKDTAQKNRTRRQVKSVQPKLSSDEPMNKMALYCKDDDRRAPMLSKGNKELYGDDISPNRVAADKMVESKINKKKPLNVYPDDGLIKKKNPIARSMTIKKGNACETSRALSSSDTYDEFLIKRKVIKNQKQTTVKLTHCTRKFRHTKPIILPSSDSDDEEAFKTKPIRQTEMDC